MPTHVSGLLAIPEPDQHDANDVSRFRAWIAIRLCDTTARQSAMYASYPNVRMRASAGWATEGSFLGYGSDASLAVHFFSRSPVGRSCPCTKMILVHKFSDGPRSTSSGVMRTLRQPGPDCYVACLELHGTKYIYLHYGTKWSVFIGAQRNEVELAPITGRINTG